MYLLYSFTKSKRIINEFYIKIIERWSGDVYKKTKDSYMNYRQCNIFPKITRSLQEKFESDF